MPKKKEDTGSDTIKNIPAIAQNPDEEPRTWYNQFNKKWTAETIERVAFDMVTFFETNQNALHFAHFCAAYPIDRRRLHEFRKTSKTFEAAYEHVRSILVARWEGWGVTLRNPAFAIFNLFNMAGDEFKNKQEVEHSGNIVNGIEILMPKHENKDTANI